MKMKANDTRRDRVLWLLVGFAICAVGIAAYQLWRDIDIGPPAVDDAIADGIRAAERELAEIEARDIIIRERIVRIYDETAERALSLSGDALANIALERAERYRRTLASRDILPP